VGNLEKLRLENVLTTNTEVETIIGNAKFLTPTYSELKKEFGQWVIPIF